jgi:hypothetical protein
MFRKFSSLAIWVVLGVALALAPLACSSDSTTTTPPADSGSDVLLVTPDSSTAS